MKDLRGYLRAWAVAEQGIGDAAVQHDGILIPVELARTASLASRRTGAPSPGWPGDRDVPSKASVLDFVSKLAAHGKPVDAGDAALAAALCALCRCSASDDGGLAEELDRFFDLAMCRFVLDSHDVRMSKGQAASSVGPGFFEGRQPSLFISTRQAQREAIGVMGNVGDNFGVALYRRLTGRKPDAVGIWVGPDVPLFLTIGSVLARARGRSLVWGTGAIQPLAYARQAAPAASVFMGVRGPRTSEEVLRKHGVYARPIGDPGILLPAVMDPSDVSVPDIDIGVVSHSVDKSRFQSEGVDLFQVTNYGTLAEFVKSMTRCRRIVSTGLHGMIFAHALGIPAVVVKVGDRITGQEFKFRDYSNWVGAYPGIPRLDLTGYQSLGEIDWREVAEHAWLPDSMDATDLLATFPFDIDAGAMAKVRGLRSS